MLIAKATAGKAKREYLSISSVLGLSFEMYRLAKTRTISHKRKKAYFQSFFLSKRNTRPIKANNPVTPNPNLTYCTKPNL